MMKHEMRALGWALVAAGLLAMGCGDDDDVTSSKDAGEQPAPMKDASGGEPTDHDAGHMVADAEAPAPVQGDDPTEVILRDGVVRGDVNGDSVRFLAIPYAKPPTGALRWQAPEDPEPWSEPRHPTKFASPCPQPPSQQSASSTNEDCLYLNVWRPNDVKPGAPVMVWIHGGGFTTGSAADLVPASTGNFLWYNGQPFAERGIVVVTLNYRLGVMGFFAHPALGDEGSPVGNQGLLDQRHALKWVQKNIEAFGGDPDNVTIFGESAGAGSVCMHVVSPGSRGLFHRAVSQSGGCTGPARATPEEIDTQLEQFASDHGCEGDDALECLRALPAEELVSTDMVDRTMGMDALRTQFRFGAVVDGEGGFLPEPARELFDRGEGADVPYILGTNNDEAQLYYISATVPTSDEEYEAAIVERYGDFADRVLEQYPIADFEGDYKKAMVRIASDAGLICGTLDTARRAAGSGMTIYMYNFNVPWSIGPELFGASHASEISHVFGTPYMESEENVAVAEAMNEYWATFAETGDPNFDGAPSEWPRFMPDADDNDQRIQFDPSFEVVDNFRKEECTLWREYEASLDD